MRPLLLIALLAGFSVAAEARAPQIKAEHCPGDFTTIVLRYDGMDAFGGLTPRDDAIAMRVTHRAGGDVSGINCATGRHQTIPKRLIWKMLDTPASTAPRDVS